MKKSTAAQLDMVRNRVRSLKSSFAVQLRSKDPEESLIPRVAATVLKEGEWLVGLAERLVAKKGVTLSKGDEEDIKAAEAFFSEKNQTYADEIERGLFIDRVECEFITHMEKMVLLSMRLDAQIKSQIASIDEETDESDEVAKAIEEEIEV